MDSRLCLLCRGTKHLCGKPYCPILARTAALAKIRPVVSSGKLELFGSTPPSIFVGRTGYPTVFAGPATPPERGDTSIYDFPEKWLGLDIDRILAMRLSMVLGRERVDVRRVNDRYVRALQELAISSRPVDVELLLAKPPRPMVSFSEYEPPLGPRAPIRGVRVVGNASAPRIVERLYSDEDALAETAVVELYRAGIPVTYIQRLLSVGALGKRGNRRLVPTRWSITAVDDIVSRHLIGLLKSFPEIDTVQLFYRVYARNLFIAILVPGKWSFEWMEAWFPGSTWNRWGKEVAVEGDYELYMGRRDYASIGGCYYATRLAVAEYLYSIGRQATAIVFREAYPGFDIPIGVWFVRENIRAMFRSRPIKLSSLEEALRIVDRLTVLGARRWVEESRLLKMLLRTRRIDEYAVGRS